MAMKKKAIVIDGVDSRRSCLVNATSEHTSSLSKKIQVPIICLDDDDADDLMIDNEYKLFLDNLRDDNSLSSRFEVDNGESNTRIFSADSKRPKLENENPLNKRVLSQQIKRKNVEVSRVKIRQDIQRDNRVAQRRNRRIAELEAPQTLRTVPFVKTQLRDNNVKKTSEVKAESTVRDVPLVRTEEDIQRDNTLLSQGRKRKSDEFKAETLRKHVPFVRTGEDIQRDNRVSEGRKGNIAETKVAETSRVGHVVNKVTELNDVDETFRSKDVFVGRRKKNGEQSSAAVVDKDYLTYLTWLVDSIKDSTTKPMENLHKDQSDFDPPVSDTLKESTRVTEKDVGVKVKIEQDVESWSDDSDIIEVSDSPFPSEEGVLFVSSKRRIDLDEGSKEDESGRSWFRKELMDVLSKPYDEAELKKLHREASIHRKMTRCREFRKGRESDYETNELGKSYREMFTDFEKEYKHVDGVDKASALELLRGFFFYLKNVSHDGAFKPWQKNQWLQPKGDDGNHFPTISNLV